jgi:hypothetical protein
VLSVSISWIEGTDGMDASLHACEEMDCCSLLIHGSSIPISWIDHDNGVFIFGGLSVSLHLVELTISTSEDCTRLAIFKLEIYGCSETVMFFG